MVPDEVTWLKGLPEPTLMRDVDRFVDQLYDKVIRELNLPHIVAQFHRYVVDLNRLPTDIDQGSVEGAVHPAGSFTTGLHWSRTTVGEPLITEPMPMALHEKLVSSYFKPFHDRVKAQYKVFREQGYDQVFHIDAHSMPSMGTRAHRDPGQKRAEIVISDVDGQSCSADFKDLVIEAYEQAGFQVAYNWPYKGGRLTQTYGRPELGQHCIQVELNRALYMNEDTKQKSQPQFFETSEKLAQAMRFIWEKLS